ncbi:hypothetical protein V5799_000537 [Amblyomma americanum]|uniref:SCP domain-containing protein n=1 Tax=Amblyomma americanum TaxID=6943 RepID=A0AAQ4D2S9_AMBAM
MLEMCWDNQLAEVAQALAERCSTPQGIMSHDRPDDRTTPTFSKAGQNLFSELAPITTKTVDIKWHFVVRDRFDENYLYSSSKAEMYEAVKGTTYSTQMAWARSYAVGCGFTYNFVYPNVQKTNDPNEGAFGMFIYVCNYAPAGNMIDKEMYRPVPPCSLCPEATECNKATGLCWVTGVEPGMDKTTTTTTTKVPPITEPDGHPPSDSAPEAVAAIVCPRSRPHSCGRVVARLGLTFVPLHFAPFVFFCQNSCLILCSRLSTTLCRMFEEGRNA